MKILSLFSLLSSFSVRALAHDEAISGRYNDYENLEPEIVLEERIGMNNLIVYINF